MDKRIGLGVALLIIFLVAALSFTLDTCPVEAQYYGDIFIRADGTVEGTDNILRSEDVYTFSGNVFGHLSVQRNNVVVDGQGYTLKEPGNTSINIVLSKRSNVTIKNITIESGWGTLFDTCDNIKISGLKISNIYGAGINLWGTTGSTVEGNMVTNSTKGFILFNARNNIIRNNTLADNGVGIEIQSSTSGSTLRNNHLNNNQKNIEFVIFSSNLNQNYASDVDASNTVDGRPIYYWVNQRDQTVPADAGCVILVNCTRITVQNLNIHESGRGILLIYTTDSTISRNTVTSSGMGVTLVNSSRNTISENSIESQNGILLMGSSFNNVTGNNLVGDAKTPQTNGINLDSSSKNNLLNGNRVVGYYFGVHETNYYASLNSVVGNDFSDNTNGISCQGTNVITDNNITRNNGTAISVDGNLSTIMGNTLRDNGRGIELIGSGNVLRNNTMENNGVNFNSVDAQVNDVDVSNTVNGKPIYYWVNLQNITVPSDAGYVCLINCTNITVQNLQLSNNGQGIALSGTSNSTISKNTVTSNIRGILLLSSKGNVISENSIAYNTIDGIHCSNSVTNSLMKNTVAKNSLGISMVGSSENTIVENLLKENNGFAMEFTENQSNNVLYHNDFINNKVQSGLQVSMPAGAPFAKNVANPDSWDNGSEGNYWSDYKTRYTNASEIGNSGIGNTPFFINENNIDHYPLMNPMTETPTVPSPSPSPSPSPTPTASSSEKPSASASPSTSQQLPMSSPETQPTTFQTELIYATVAVTVATAVIVAVAVAFKRIKQSSPNSLTN